MHSSPCAVMSRGILMFHSLIDIVLCLWQVSFLDIVEHRLQVAGIRVVKLNGGMSAGKISSGRL